MDLSFLFVTNPVYLGDFSNSEQTGKLADVHRFCKGIGALNCDKTNSLGRKISRVYQFAKDHVVYVAVKVGTIGFTPLSSSVLFTSALKVKSKLAQEHDVRAYRRKAGNTFSALTRDGFIGQADKAKGCLHSDRGR